MSDQKEEHIGKWFNPLLTSEERERLRSELNSEEIEDYQKLWEKSENIKPTEGEGFENRWQRLDAALNEEPLVVPLYKTKKLRMAVGSLVAASLLFALLYLIKPIEVRFDQQVVALKAELKEVELPDGSVVKLNAESQLQYPGEGWQNERIVSISGEAFFEVTKNETPFVVQSNGTTIKVLGTSFNVRSRGEMVSVSCVTGKVGVSSKVGEEVYLTKGLGTRVVGERPSTPDSINISQIASWVSGQYYFEGTPMTQVFEEIERQYNVSISSDLDFENIAFTGSFSNKNLNSTLSIVCLSAAVEFRVNGGNITLY
jgi:ferric-dicitrate binding protein FerR (iron transport regulator)